MHQSLTITDDFSAFSNRWGHVNQTLGQLTVSTLANEWQDAGAMFQGVGLGYGTFRFKVATEGFHVGPYALLWPENYIRSGAELDVMEIHSYPKGNLTYGATHYDYSPDRAVEHNDQAVIHEQPPLDPRVLHEYSVEWSPGHLWYAVDGVPYAHESTHVPKDAAHGGVNMLPGFGIHLWPTAILLQQGLGNAITLCEFSYDPWF